MGGLRERVWLWRLHRWVTTAEVSVPDPLPVIRLRAVISTWHEGDIIATTVRNAFDQGCDAVHVLDDGSPDDTVERAAAAGATVEEVGTSDRYDPGARVRRGRALVEQVSRASGDPHVWWLHVDADELPEGPDGSTIRQLLDGLDRSHRIVGSDTVNHYPTRADPIAAGADPRRFASNAQARPGVACRQGHWKHPLVRWDAAGPTVAAGPGFHVAVADHRLVEPRRALVTHHYPYRNRAATEARLARLEPRLHGATWAMGRRQANLDAVYREAYAEVDPFDMVGPGQRLAPVPRPPVR